MTHIVSDLNEIQKSFVRYKAPKRRKSLANRLIHFSRHFAHLYGSARFECLICDYANANEVRTKDHIKKTHKALVPGNFYTDNIDNWNEEDIRSVSKMVFKDANFVHKAVQELAEQKDAAATASSSKEVFNPQDFLMRQVKNELGVNTNEEAEFALKQEAEDEQEEMEEEDSNSQGGTEKSEDTTLFANSGDDAPLSLMIVKKEVKTEPV
ncbi:hypothetical protein WR25_14404 [Diploscapter pachys]|uniref:Uncharacterized protein n=1 Tax=Diploscapter pachys TaxID=2018661 RepID=A0A2A2JGI0_9BILA|nr:hypothetical protein WR25_14404 [Diploscapter pachys]